MSLSPFNARPVSLEGERRRARLVVAIATRGIAATLLAYGISPGVRHAVGHAAHSMGRAVSHVLDRDHAGTAAKHRVRLVQPLHQRPPKSLDRAAGHRPAVAIKH